MFALFRSPEPSSALQLHHALVTASRRPEFYQQGGVPDTLDGRYELLILHAILLFRRLRAGQQDLAQKIFDLLFAQFDLNLRELGVGDMGVGKRIKKMSQGFYGRAQAYEAALDDDAALHAALARNLFGTLPDEPGLNLTQPFIWYTRRAVALLDQQPIAEIAAGTVVFPAFPVSEP